MFTLNAEVQVSCVLTVVVPDTVTFPVEVPWENE